jgi:hypothetical protein
MLQKPPEVNSESKPRSRIADIIQDSGKLGTDQPAESQGDLALMKRADAHSFSRCRHATIS